MRPTADQTFLLIAQALAMRATCPRRQVGCVLVDKNGEIDGTGYNGTASKMEHCIDVPCAGADMLSGIGHESCEAIHAELNALRQCKSQHNLKTAYITTAPCKHCIKLLASTSIERIVFLEDYVHSDAMEYWSRSGDQRGIDRQWQRVRLWYDIVALD